MTLSTTSPRAKQRWGVLGALVFLFTIFGAAATLAVHDANLFELDVPSANAVDEAAAGDDWDVICKDNPTTCTFKASVDQSLIAAPSAFMTASAHDADVLFSGLDAGDESLAATIFHGSSKDIGDISTWRWKDDAGGLPDKDNLLHAYSARYTKPASASCPNAAGTTFTGTCSVIYFGSDRYANDGDATQAFWFLQNKVTLDPTKKSNGGFEFSGVHRNGDLLVISEFSNGGTTSSITVYKWFNGALDFVAGGTPPGQLCGLSPSDPFCGIVNTDTGTTFSPWTFLDKGSSTDFRQGELFEAGINLSDPTINLANECFSTVVAETRSSTSTTATLKDFVLGQFQVCEPTMTTQANNTGTGTVTPGTAVTDTARIAIQGATSAADPTGTVTFYLCGPIATTNPLSACPTGGTNVGTGTLANQTGGTTTDGIAVATSPTVNDSTKAGQTPANVGAPLGPGRYCFRAEWPGDTTYPLTTNLTHTNNSTECFSVQDTTSITTAQKWLPQDTATISTGSGASAPTGTVTFSLYENGTCSGTPATGATFTDSTAPYETNNSTYRTSSTTISWSATFVPTSGSGFAGSTTTRCEKSELTITNDSSAFPPPAE